MLGYRRKSFRAAHAFLSKLRKDPDSINTVVELQRLLINEIVRAEEKISACKQELALLRATDKNDSRVQKRTAFLANRIEGYRQLNYIWRNFGDAIAFLYLDKFAIKQTYFNTANPYPKQDAGFIAGKVGLEKEIAVMEAAVAAGVPSLLVGPELGNFHQHAVE